MQTMAPISTILIVTVVLLFFFLGVAIMVIMDHKAKLPGGFTNDPFSIAGMRRDHPAIAFLTAIILLGIIVSLVLSMVAAIGGSFGLFKAPEKPGLLVRLSEERTAERLRHFHNLPDEDSSRQGKKNVCFVCHGDYPHSKEPMVRTLMNMHTQFIGCMTCHSDQRKVPENSITLRWLNFSGIAVQGPPFGTDVDPKTGYLIETDDVYSKIVAYSTYDGAEQLLEITDDDPRAKEFAALSDRLSDHDRESVKKTFHKLIMLKGRACSRCHTEESKSYVPFRKLGFSERRIQDVTNRNIIGIMEKSKDFYMPSLMKSKASPSAVEAQPGTKADTPRSKESGAMRVDPKEWWGRTGDKPSGSNKEKR